MRNVGTGPARFAALAVAVLVGAWAGAQSGESVGVDRSEARWIGGTPQSMASSDASSTRRRAGVPRRSSWAPPESDASSESNAAPPDDLDDDRGSEATFGIDIGRYVERFRSEPGSRSALADELATRLLDAAGVRSAIDEAVRREQGGDVDALRLLVAAAGRVPDPRTATTMLDRVGEFGPQGLNYLLHAVAQLRGPEQVPDRTTFVLGDFFELRPVVESDAVVRLTDLLRRAATPKDPSDAKLERAAPNLTRVVAVTSTVSATARAALLEAAWEARGPVRACALMGVLSFGSPEDRRKAARLALADPDASESVLVAACGAAAELDDGESLELLQRTCRDWSRLDTSRRAIVVAGASSLVIAVPGSARARWTRTASNLIDLGLHDGSSAVRTAACQSLAGAVRALPGPVLGDLDAVEVLGRPGLSKEDLRAVGHAIGYVSIVTPGTAFERVVRNDHNEASVREAAWSGVTKGAREHPGAGLNEFLNLAADLRLTDPDRDVRTAIERLILAARTQ